MHMVAWACLTDQGESRGRNLNRSLPELPVGASGQGFEQDGWKRGTTAQFLFGVTFCCKNIAKGEDVSVTIRSHKCELNIDTAVRPLNHKTCTVIVYRDAHHDINLLQVLLLLLFHV